MNIQSLQLALPADSPFLVRVFGVSEDEFDDITSEDTHYELIDGILIMHSPASFGHEELCSLLSFLVSGFVSRRRLGRVAGSHAEIRPRAGRRFEPDLTFYSHARNPTIHTIVEGTADLIVEVLSASTREYDLNEKRALYREARTPEIWFVDPERKTVLQDVRSGRTYRSRLLRGGKLRSAVLPGFWLELEWLWQRPVVDLVDCLDRVLTSVKD